MHGDTVAAILRAPASRLTPPLAQRTIDPDHLQVRPEDDQPHVTWPASTCAGFF